MVALWTYRISPFETETVEVSLCLAFFILSECFRVEALSGLINIFFSDAVPFQKNTKKDISDNLCYHNDADEYLHKTGSSYGGAYCLNLHASPTT